MLGNEGLPALTHEPGCRFTKPRLFQPKGRGTGYWRPAIRRRQMPSPVGFPLLRSSARTGDCLLLEPYSVVNVSGLSPLATSGADLSAFFDLGGAREVGLTAWKIGRAHV